MNAVVILLNLLLVSGLLYWVWRKDNSIIKKFYWPAALVKLIAGVVVGLVHYRYYAQSDTVFFFESALQLREIARQDVATYFKMLVAAPDGYFLGEHRTLLFIKLVSVVTVLTGGKYYLGSLLFSLISFLAAWNMARWVSRLAPSMAVPAVVAFLFFPSCVFWSSGILKESLAMAGIFYLASISIVIWLRHRLTLINIVLLIPAVWMVWSLKYYYAAVFIPVAIALLLTQRLAEKLKELSLLKEGVLFVGIMMVLLLAGGVFHPNLKPSRLPDVIYETHQLSLAKSDHANVVNYDSLRPTWPSLFSQAPFALASGLFAPLIPRFSNLFQVLSVFENLLLFILTLFAFPLLKRLPNSPYRLWVLAILVYVVLLSVFIALSTPNVGTLVRYRVGFLPFFVLLISQQPFLRQQLERFLIVRN